MKREKREPLLTQRGIKDPKVSGAQAELVTWDYRYVYIHTEKKVRKWVGNMLNTIPGSIIVHVNKC